MRPPARHIAAALVTVLAVGTACSDTSAAGSIGVTATNSSCKVADTTLDAGKHTFRVSNDGSDVTEVYVYAPGDRIVGEVENIGPGTQRDLKVNLDPGTYEVACKPGQKGHGIRTKLVVKGGSSSATTAAAGPPDRTVTVTARDYTYSGLKGFSPKRDERVAIVLKNTDPDPTMKHEFELTAPDGTTLGEIEPVAAGKTGTAVFAFDQVGTYTYICGVDDHAKLGMKGTFTVTS
jgi:iron uptake system component EfeO